MECRINDNEFLCSNVKLGDMVWVNSPQYGECWGYVTGLHEHSLAVRVDIPNSHPSMAEVIRETGMDGDQVELIDLVPFDCVEHIRYLTGPDLPLRVWTRPIGSSERAERARRSGHTRLALAELDAHLTERSLRR